MNEQTKTSGDTKYFSEQERASVADGPIPTHIAIIPDGNRRWANNHSSPASTGHRRGADVVMDTVKAAKELGVKTLTLYSFSTENWTRPTDEVNAIFAITENYLRTQKDEMAAHGIRCCTIGDLSRLPPSVSDAVSAATTTTEHCRAIDLVLALNYGGRDDLLRTIRLLAQQAAEGSLSPSEITEATITENLDTAAWQDPELLIRTSGELRISNFLLWQISYSEIYSCPVLWPDFTPGNLLEAVTEYQRRERRVGT